MGTVVDQHSTLNSAPIRGTRSMPLDNDNKSHRSFSNSLDSAFAYDNPDSRWRWTGVPQVYSGVARPVIHGVYHTARNINSGNPEEWARAKDQFSKFGTGETQTEYLKKHREDAAAAANKAAEDAANKAAAGGSNAQEK